MIDLAGFGEVKQCPLGPIWMGRFPAFPPHHLERRLNNISDNRNDITHNFF